MPAIILNHTRHEVKLQDPRMGKPFDPREQSVVERETPESIQAAIDFSNGERCHLRLLGISTTLVPYPKADDPWARSVAIDHVTKLMAEFGADTVARWVRNQAARMGVNISGVQS
jgi:hypothetical protein